MFMDGEYFVIDLEENNETVYKLFIMFFIIWNIP